jgi:hypothetical protein
MRSLIETGVMTNMFGYITISDIASLVVKINPILLAYDTATGGDLSARYDISYHLWNFKHANGYD